MSMTVHLQNASMLNQTLLGHESLTSDDAAWALGCAFLILTMQTGFAMLECGNVSAKNASSIMIKNCVDVTVGGLSYWVFGYGLTFGKDHPTWFCGFGFWFFSMDEEEPTWGSEYSHYFFHFSFASTATTIVSGAVAERMKFYSYMVFSFYNTIVYCIPASWAWNSGHGWLHKFGFFDFAGVCIVHFCGGVSALVAAIMLGPRISRFEDPNVYRMSSPVTALTGMFMLWWAWMSFNAGSTFGVEADLWKVSALAAVTTLNAGMAGGLMGLIISMIVAKGKILIPETINSVLGGLVAVTGICPITTPTESLVIGGIGGAIAVLTQYLIAYLKIDDPVGAAPVHFFAALWGTIAVGLFAYDITGKYETVKGLIHGGGFRQLLIQLTGVAAVGTWSACTTFLGMLILKKTMGIRCGLDEEILGADWCHHEIQSDTWSNELFGNVVQSLKKGNLDERTAAVVLGQLGEQVRRAKSRNTASETDTPKSTGSESSAFSILESLHKIKSRGTIPTPEPEPTFPELIPRKKSYKQELDEILERNPVPPMPLIKRTIGPFNYPLYKEYKSYNETGEQLEDLESPNSIFTIESHQNAKDARKLKKT